MDSFSSFKLLENSEQTAAWSLIRIEKLTAIGSARSSCQSSILQYSQGQVFQGLKNGILRVSHLQMSIIQGWENKQQILQHLPITKEFLKNQQILPQLLIILGFQNKQTFCNSCPSLRVSVANSKFWNSCQQSFWNSTKSANLATAHSEFSKQTENLAIIVNN
jgi:hypothetical protein